VTLATAPAFAVDGKSYPGSACLPYSSANMDIMERFAEYIENTAANNSLLVICPVIKDDIASTGGTDYVRITFSKPDSTGFYCAIYSKNASGGGTYSSSEWNFSAGGTYNMVLTDVAGHASGTFSLYCILPPGAKIHSYRVDEIN
jgi:hypothetical protein